ncbi:DUF397 domain-containing protein [Streptomyces sp. NPDC052309]|uniref:DUF397 domain-containing protein n=1 Tax=Streptomyces sp. NPDC052309 TaxID=3155421 RepID=UPI0034286B56
MGAVPVPNNNSQPPAAWCYSGNQLKRWRTMANISREGLAAAGASLERGVRMPTPRVLDVADELCGAQGMLSAAKESSCSDNEGDNCVEVARSAAIHVRDSKTAPGGPGLRIAPPAWSAFIAAVLPRAARL